MNGTLSIQQLSSGRLAHNAHKRIHPHAYEIATARRVGREYPMGTGERSEIRSIKDCRQGNEGMGLSSTCHGTETIANVEYTGRN